MNDSTLKSMASFGLVKPDVLLEIKIDQFSAFVRELTQRLGDTSNMQKVIDYEVGKVMERAVQLTSKASPFKIERSWDTRVWFPVGMNTNWYKLRWHVKDEIYAIISASYEKSVARKNGKLCTG